MGKVFLYLAFDVETMFREKRDQFPVYAVPPMSLADKIEYRQAIFLGSVAQAATQLLQKDGKTFGRAKE